MGNFSHLKFDEISSILSLYGAADLVQYEPQSHGTSNSNYLVETKEQKYLLKIANDKSLNELETEIDLLFRLDQAGFQYIIAPIPLKEHQKRFVFKLDTYYGVLFPFINKGPIAINRQTCSQLGEILGHLHSIDFGPSEIRPYDELGQTSEHIYQFLQSSACPDDFKQTVEEIIAKDSWEELKDQHFPQGFMHGDLYFDNALGSAQNVDYIIDFEQAGRGNLLLDLGICITGSCLKDNSLQLELMQKLISSYQEKRPLSPYEKKHFFSYLKLACLSISLWRIERFQVKQLDPSKRCFYRPLLDLAHSIHTQETAIQRIIDAL
jgi:homoserine kinase type II